MEGNKNYAIFQHPFDKDTFNSIARNDDFVHAENLVTFYHQNNLKRKKNHFSQTEIFNKKFHFFLGKNLICVSMSK